MKLLHQRAQFSAETALLGEDVFHGVPQPTPL